MPVSRNNRAGKQKPASKKQKMPVSKLLAYLPDEVIAAYVAHVQADKHVKKLPALLFFKLLLFGVLKSSRLSTHLLEHYYNSEQFSLLTGKGGHRTRHSSIADRLKRLPPELFEKLFAYVTTALFDKFFTAGRGREELLLKSFDSTMVAASAALLKEGMVVGKKPKQGPGKKQVKFSISLCNGFPVEAAVAGKQAYLSEDVALGEFVLSSSKADRQVLVFDRGIGRRDTFDRLTGSERMFVTRINTTGRYQEVDRREVGQPQTQTLHLKEDLLVRLKNTAGNWTEHAYRLIKAVSLESGQELWFLSNLQGAAAGQITEMYRQRWQIEVFFKFLKQHLSLEHMLSYEPKAIEGMLYVRLIAAALILVYKKENKLSSYKMAKETFADELEMDMIRYLVAESGGDPGRITQLIGYHKFW